MSETAAAVQEFYRPILFGYFSALAVYYLAMTPLHWINLEGVDRIKLVTASAIAAGVALFGTWTIRRNSSDGRRSDVLLIAMNLIVVCNVVVALQISFASEKMIYFMILAVLFSLASLSFRQSAFSIAAAGIAMISFMPQLDENSFATYAFLSFGAAMASVAIAFFLRKAITQIANAKSEVELELDYAREVGEEMRQKSLVDSLTGLPNRRAFFNALRNTVRTVTHSRADGDANANAWLLLMDLDGFKAVNDVHGHLTGDQLLKQVASRLEIFAKNDVHVSRMGGDEFNLIFASSDSEQEVVARCTDLLDLIAAAYQIDGRQIRISCSLGCKRMDLSDEARSQISLADYALMVAKKEGKNRVVLFGDNHAQEAEERYKVEDALRHSDLRQEIDLLFQPQVDLGSNRMVGAEALARWNSPSVGNVGPNRFIKIAEESGLITGITLVVVEKALEAMKSWSVSIPLSINLSTNDLISDPTIDQIVCLAEVSAVDPALIEFEVTETGLMADFERARDNLDRLAQTGFSIALDDFGTGYSNFSYLRKLPIDKLKIDKSFVEDPADPSTQRILSSLTGMARILEVQSVLEGIEDEVHLLMAKRAGASLVQGYYFGKPMGAAELIDFYHSSEADVNSTSAVA